MTPREKFNEAAKRQRLTRLRREADRARKLPRPRPEAQITHVRANGYENLKDIAALFKVSLSSVHQAISIRGMKYIEIGRSRYVKIEDYKNFLEDNQRRRIEAGKNLGRKNVK